MDANANNNCCQLDRNIALHLFSGVEKYPSGFSSWLTENPENNEYMLVKFVPKGKKTLFEQHVLANYSDSRNAKELSKRCGYDCLKTFTRHFKKFFDQTPHQWVLARKLEDIYSLVIKTDLTIREIAKMYAFNQPAYLKRIFRLHFGISPDQLREGVIRI